MEGQATTKECLTQEATATQVQNQKDQKIFFWKLKSFTDQQNLKFSTTKTASQQMLKHFSRWKRKVQL